MKLPAELPDRHHFCSLISFSKLISRFLVQVVDQDKNVYTPRWCRTQSRNELCFLEALGCCGISFCEWYRLGIYMVSFFSSDTQICCEFPLACFLGKYCLNWSPYLGTLRCTSRELFHRSSRTFWRHTRIMVIYGIVFSRTQLVRVPSIPESFSL